jgi:bacteriocin-like protein
MSDENIIKNEPAVEAASSSELTEKDLETVTGGSSDILPKEQVSLSFSKIEFKYKEQKPDGD